MGPIISNYSSGVSYQVLHSVVACSAPQKRQDLPACCNQVCHLCKMLPVTNNRGNRLK